MALEFDPLNTRSPELCAVVAIADAMAATAEFQELTELAEADARLKFTYGIDPLPANGQQYTVDEAANLFCMTRINRIDGTHAVKSDSLALGSVAPLERGQLQITVRRYLREGEDRQQKFLAFWDVASRLLATLQLKIDVLQKARVQSIVSAKGPGTDEVGESVAQGEYLFEIFVATWGDGNLDE